MNAIDRLCRGVRPHFSDHADGLPLPAVAAVTVGLHLLFCPMCRRTYASVRASRDALRALGAADEPVNPG